MTPARTASPLPRTSIRRFRRVARSGFALNGLLHLLLAGIAIRLALGDADDASVDQSGVLHQLASTPLGVVLLWAAVVGLLALGLWQVTQALVLVEEPHRLRRWGQRVVEAAKGVVYLVLGSSALLVALGASGPSSADVARLADALLRSEPGVVILLGVGCAFLGVGIGFASIGVRGTFARLIRLPGGRMRGVVLLLGTIGYVAKGVALGIVGVVVVTAVVTGDAHRATGLDGALRWIVELPLGTVLLLLIAVGLGVFGVFLLARTRLARLQPSRVDG
ncbi:DUF1206 domain-containing protein [Agrococcus versicolor]|uniref:DUF1206 domain-containing protein n=1 Tax=Agrococcus versicolor TaxID=501482 RepID=A0ABN3AMY9_9MICO